MGLDPFSKAALGSAGVGALGGVFSNNPDYIPESYEGTAVDPVKTLSQADSSMRAFGDSLLDRYNQGFEFENAYAQQPGVFTGGGLPMPIGMTGFDPTNPAFAGKGGKGGGPGRTPLPSNLFHGGPNYGGGGGGGRGNQQDEQFTFNDPPIGGPPAGEDGYDDFKLHFNDEKYMKGKGEVGPFKTPPLPTMKKRPYEQKLNAKPAVDPSPAIYGSPDVDARVELGEYDPEHPPWMENPFMWDMQDGWQTPVPEGEVSTSEYFDPQIPGLSPETLNALRMLGLRF